MITGNDIYEVLAALVPLYVAMILGYGSVRWWNIFTAEQCSGINRFVAVFAVPLLSFNFISSYDPYKMNYQFIAADSAQKLVILAVLFLWQTFSKRDYLDWVITLFSLSTLPNTLVIGIPLLKAMYGDVSASLMVQIIVLQGVIWYNLILFLFEYRSAKLFIADKFPDTARSIASFQAEPDVVSLNGREPLQADAQTGEDGKLRVVLRKSTSSRSAISHCPSNLSGMEIYSIDSSRVQTPRADRFNHNDFHAILGSKMASPRQGYMGTLNFEDEMESGRSMNMKSEVSNGSLMKPLVSGSRSGRRKKDEDGWNKEVHMFVWSSSASPVSERSMKNRSTSYFGSFDASKAVVADEIGTSLGSQNEIATPVSITGADIEIEVEDGHRSTRESPAMRSPFLGRKTSQTLRGDNMNDTGHQMPQASVVTRLILIMVWRKLIRNPNTYASLLGLLWSLISFRWKFEMPTIIRGSILILSNTGLGMAMFSLGLFMALQPKIIACGKSLAALTMAMRFLVGPAVAAATSISLGIRGVLLHVSIVQAALPQGIVPFVFAKEYNCHADILSTSVIFGMVVALPVTIIYYILLGL